MRLRSYLGKCWRAEFIYPIFGDPDPSVHELAYLEMGRAPYPMIKRLGKSIDVKHVLPMLGDVKYIEWRSLAILLLAQRDEPEYRRQIISSLEHAERFRLPMNLAAWITAGVEVAPVQTFEFVNEKCCGDATRSPDELNSVYKALSRVGTGGDEAMRSQVIECYRKLLDKP